MTEDLRDRILEAGLPHVAFDGWDPAAFRQGAQDLGLDPELVAEYFPRGAVSMAMAFSDWADRQMAERYAAEETEALGVTAKVALAVRLRFDVIAPYEEAVRRSLRVMGQPLRAADGLTALHRTSDAVWNLIGDTSVDHNWYTKRMLLGGVISSTTLYWLNDRSPEKEKSWQFLDRRLNDVVKVGGRLGKAMKAALSLPDRLAGAAGRPSMPFRRPGAGRGFGRSPFRRRDYARR